eukprot:s1362_g23.t1
MSSEETWPWRCPCGRLNRKTHIHCPLCKKHWSKGTRHQTTPKTYNWEQEEDQSWAWEPEGQTEKPRMSSRSSSARRRKGKGKGKGQQQKDGEQTSPFLTKKPLPPWPTTESIFGPVQATQTPVAPETAASSSTSTAAALAAHAELVSAVRQTYPDMARAPANIQAAVKKADQNLSKQIGSDLHKASSQIEKASKQLNTLRSARAKHKDTWLKHLRDSVATWEGQIKAYQEQQQLYGEQILKAKNEILQARRALQTVSKHAGNVTIKAEQDVDNMEEEPEMDTEEQLLAQKVQELLQQSASLAIPPEIQEIKESEEEEVPSSKRQRSLEPFSHQSTPAPRSENAAM